MYVSVCVCLIYTYVCACMPVSMQHAHEACTCSWMPVHVCTQAPVQAHRATYKPTGSCQFMIRLCSRMCMCVFGLVHVYVPMLCMCVRGCVCMQGFLHANVCLCVSLCTCIHTYIHSFAHIRLHMLVWIKLSVCECVCMYTIHPYVYTYACIVLKSNIQKSIR
jgi:hypothetical protein